MLTKKRSSILLIEDNRLESQLIADMLTEWGAKGFILKTTETLTKGIEFLKGSKINLILLDLNLPDSQGIETLSTLISCEKKIPVVVISALEDEAIALESLAKGASEYLLKGHFDGQILIRSIHYAIERKRIEEELRQAYTQLEKKVDKRTEELQKINQRLATEMAERKEIEKQLRESAEQYIGLFENSIEAVFTVDLKGNFTQINKAFEAISGYDRDEVIGQNFRTGITDETAEKVFKAYNSLYLTGNPIKDLKYDFARKDGQKRTVEGYVNAIRRDDRVVGFQGTLRDITERDHSVEALRESEERYRNLFENSIEAVLTVDVKGTITSANYAFSAMSGYTVDELVGMNYRELIRKEDAQRTYEAYNRLYRTGEPIRDMISSRVHKNGETRTAQSHVNVIRKGNEIVGFQTTIRDITESKRAEEALRESELFLKETQQIARLGGWKANPHTDYLEWTDGVYDIIEAPLDYKPGLTEGMKYYPPEYMPIIKEKVSNCLETGEPFSVEVEVITETGKRLWTEVRGLAPVVEGERSYVVGTFQDITERKKAEQALKVSEEKYRNVIENAQESIIIVVDGIIQYANPMTEKLTGYTLEELKSKSLSDLVHPENHEGMMKEYLRKLSGDSLTYPSEYKYITKDGQPRWYESVGIPVSWEGKPGFLSFARDITDRKNLERQLLQSQKMEAIGSMAGGIAHNFNNILAGIMGYSEYLLSERSEDDPDYKALKTIFDGTMRASQLTRQLLNVTRAGEYQLRRCDINGVVDKVLPLIMGTFDKSIEIRTNLGMNLPSFNADSAQLEQCLLNLCINARDAMPSGGSLVIETCLKDLDDNFVRSHIGSQTGKHLVLSVSDNGIGMSQEVKGRIFEPFFTTKPEQEGTGMGLSTVYGTVSKHRGFITVYSEQGEGTTFRLYFPVTRGRIVESQVKDSIQEERGHETILIIDDERVVREIWAEYLRNIGYLVILAENGEEGISLFLQQRDTIDLIILDVIMPKMGGRDTLNKIIEINPHAKVLIASGYSENGKAGEVITETVGGFIQKPTTLKELSEKIRLVLDGTDS